MGTEVTGRLEKREMRVVGRFGRKVARKTPGGGGDGGNGRFKLAMLAEILDT